MLKKAKVTIKVKQEDIHYLTKVFKNLKFSYNLTFKYILLFS